MIMVHIPLYCCDCLLKPVLTDCLPAPCDQLSTDFLTPVLQGLPADSLLPKFVLEVDSIHDVPPSRGKQVVPNFRRPGGALGEAFGKERALLQVLCIHALYKYHLSLTCMACKPCGSAMW